MQWPTRSARIGFLLLATMFLQMRPLSLPAVSAGMALPHAARRDTAASSSRGGASGAAAPLRFVSYNICGNSCASAAYDNDRRIDTIVAQATTATGGADQIFLQEVCRPQYDAVQAALRGLGYEGFFSRTVPARPGICGNSDYGNAVFVHGDILQSLDLELTVGGESEPIRVPCVNSTLQGRPNWACSVHLYWDNGTLAALEADRLTAQTRIWEEQGIPTVLGGDFNHSPRTSTLSRFYDRGIGDGAMGDFRESDETDAEFFDPAACQPGITLRCRSGELTVPSLGKKLDYVFFSTRDFQSPEAEVQPLDGKVSDHRMLVAAAEWAG